eukprot:TRINITY_DN5348_c0_g1_i1.p1 TRINITY_DN5348_c0_g1~~TRINITY_DN5348_c0_g1_i1.p1  ORF type:complete len:325 (+),score=105.93 TRINITY_DN5348_c0_g1_i1:310-1284(+)
MEEYEGMNQEERVQYLPEECYSKKEETVETRIVRYMLGDAVARSYGRLDPKCAINSFKDSFNHKYDPWSMLRSKYVTNKPEDMDAAIKKKGELFQVLDVKTINVWNLDLEFTEIDTSGNLRKPAIKGGVITARNAVGLFRERFARKRMVEEDAFSKRVIRNQYLQEGICKERKKRRSYKPRKPRVKKKSKIELLLEKATPPPRSIVQRILNGTCIQGEEYAPEFQSKKFPISMVPLSEDAMQVITNAIEDAQNSVVESLVPSVAADETESSNTSNYVPPSDSEQKKTKAKKGRPYGSTSQVTPVRRSSRSKTKSLRMKQSEISQ